MGYVRIFRRVHIAPGLTFNIAKHGPSLSLGVRGAHITVGRQGIRRTVGVPGTGIYYTSRQGWHSGVHSGPQFQDGATAAPGPPIGRWILLILALILLVAVGSRVLWGG